MGIDFILDTSIVVTRFNLFYFRAQIKLFGNFKQISAYFNKQQERHSRKKSKKLFDFWEFQRNFGFRFSFGMFLGS